MDFCTVFCCVIHESVFPYITDLRPFFYFIASCVLFLLTCRLAVSLVDVSESAAEPWVAMGYFSLKSKRFPRAVYFAQKVWQM